MIDVIVIGSDDTAISLDNNLENLLKQYKNKGIVVNPDMLKHAVTSVPFIGHLLMSQGVKSDPDKVSTIMDMPPPTCIAKVKFLTNQTVISYLTGLNSVDATWE